MTLESRLRVCQDSARRHIVLEVKQRGPQQDSGLTKASVKQTIMGKINKSSNRDGLTSDFKLITTDLLKP